MKDKILGDLAKEGKGSYIAGNVCAFAKEKKALKGELLAKCEL